jgi:hypothetical protein
LDDIEESKLIAEWLELRAKEVGQVAQPHDKGYGAAAKKFGRSRRSIRRVMKLAKLTAAAKKALKDAGLSDNGSVTGEVAKAEPDEQVATVHEIVRRRAEKKAEKKRKRREDKAKKLPKMKTPGIAEFTNDEIPDNAYGRLLLAWLEASDLREAWADTDDEDRQLFIDNVLLADKEAVTEDPALDD